MSHVIPLHIFQTLKSDRWNCNVCRRSRKMTELNYVRNLAGGGVAAHGHRSLAIRALRRPPHQWGLLCRVCPVGASLRCPALADGPHEQQFRMQFPRDYFNLRNSSVEIATFSDIIEYSSNGIACEMWGGGLGAAHRHRGWALFRSRIPRSARQASCGGVLQH